MRGLSEGCGDKKGCFLYPRFCGSVKCTMAASYKSIDDDHVQFEMFGEAGGYISLGFSDDKKMVRSTLL
jgi:hypothetical protein